MYVWVYHIVFHLWPNFQLCMFILAYGCRIKVFGQPQCPCKVETLVIRTNVHGWYTPILHMHKHTFNLISLSVLSQRDAESGIGLLITPISPGERVWESCNGTTWYAENRTVSGPFYPIAGLPSFSHQRRTGLNIHPLGRVPWVVSMRQIQQ